MPMNTVPFAPVHTRSVMIVTSDAELRNRLAEHLRSGRWEVHTASGGAEAMAHLETIAPEAMFLDHWLPDLDAMEFASVVASQCPATEMLRMDGSMEQSAAKSPRRNELLHALREAQEHLSPQTPDVTFPLFANQPPLVEAEPAAPQPPTSAAGAVDVRMLLPDVVGQAPSMQELARQVRLVAPHTASVLILGETGTGKELVAKAVHRLSSRAGKPFVVLNCAAIPEHLLEAELFGHTRGAFTGAVSSRVGRIEAAHGGTLFLDEIGEMPLPLQAKMLRFLENGEIQKVGENDSIRVDVRIVAATHQPLEQHAGERRFRLDLYHRLAVFPIEVPSLRERREDLPMLVEHFLQKLGESMPRKTISQEALQLLMMHEGSGNVRELAHLVQRGAILCSDAPRILAEHIRVRPPGALQSGYPRVH